MVLWIENGERNLFKQIGGVESALNFYFRALQTAIKEGSVWLILNSDRYNYKTLLNQEVFE